jgi:CheY-like chemotaxis protein
MGDACQACDGVEAVNAVKHSMETDAPIDMIFMDQVMPNMTGMEATRIIREMGYDGGIIAVTGNVLEEDMQSVLAAGTDEIVLKPLKVPHLEKIIQSTWPAVIVLIELMLCISEYFLVSLDSERPSSPRRSLPSGAAQIHPDDNV